MYSIINAIITIAITNIMVMGGWEGGETGGMVRPIPKRGPQPTPPVWRAIENTKALAVWGMHHLSPSLCVRVLIKRRNGPI